MSSASQSTHRCAAVTFNADKLTIERPWVLLSLWMLCLLTFSLPGRSSSDAVQSVDILGIAKVLVRLGVLGTGCLVLSRYLGRLRTFPAVASYTCLVPFLIWAGVSTAWSPLRSISIGQYLGLIALFAYAAIVSTVAVKRETRALILKHLNGALFICSLVVLIAYFIDSRASGLDRSALLENQLGLVHPTAAGATASLGMVLLVFGQVTADKARRILPFVIGSATHLAILLLANSRSAIAMLGVTSLLILMLFGTPRMLGRLMLIASLGFMIYPVVDPGFELVSNVLDQGSEFVSRGQSSKELSGGSGRVELWTEILKEYEQAVFLGHGYFMTSTTGYLDVWDGREMRDAHNVWLQVLVSTGIVGFILFCLGGFLLIRPIFRLRQGSRDDQLDLGLFIITAVWFSGWGLGCATFMSAIRPESVVFATILGVSVGAAVVKTGQLGLRTRTTRFATRRPR